MNTIFSSVFFQCGTFRVFSEPASNLPKFLDFVSTVFRTLFSKCGSFPVFLKFSGVREIVGRVILSLFLNTIF